jgi:two-component system sensor histidine kinase RegB
MAAGSGDITGEAPRTLPLGDVAALAMEHLTPPDRPRVVVDIASNVQVVWPARVVARALGNLLQNGVQASPADAKVHLQAERRDRFVQLRVTDRGSGMSAEQLNRAGEPFFTTKPAGAGTGLGLFVARSTAEQLGGRLDLDSAAGRGTTATLVLPADVVRSSP